MHQPLILLSAKVKFAISFHCCLVDRIAKREMAHRIFLQECCKGQCLKAIGEEVAEELVFNCLMEVEFLTQTQKHEYLFQKLRHCAEGVTEGGYLQCDYSLGQGVCGKRAYGVCHKCFQNVYNIGHTQLYNIRAKVKAGILTTDSGHREGDDSATLGGIRNKPAFVKTLCKVAEDRGYTLDKYEMAALAIPNNRMSLECFAWMDDHFNLVAESEPNSGHMTIEPITIEEIYDEYVADRHSAGYSAVSITTFRRIWRGCFPHVKRRPYIECNLKCMTCAALGLARKEHKGKNNYEIIVVVCS